MDMGYQVLAIYVRAQQPLLSGDFLRPIPRTFCLGSNSCLHSLPTHTPSTSSFFHDRPHPILSSARISYLKVLCPCASPSFIMHTSARSFHHYLYPTSTTPPLPFHPIPPHTISHNTTLSSLQLRLPPNLRQIFPLPTIRRRQHSA
jgi:hypothetical protein